MFIASHRLLLHTYAYDVMRTDSLCWLAHFWNNSILEHLRALPPPSLPLPLSPSLPPSPSDLSFRKTNVDNIVLKCSCYISCLQIFKRTRSRVGLTTTTQWNEWIQLATTQWNAHDFYVTMTRIYNWVTLLDGFRMVYWLNGVIVNTVKLGCSSSIYNRPIVFWIFSQLCCNICPKWVIICNESKLSKKSL